MTTAHRPTWAPAKGGEEEGGARFFAPSDRRMAKDQRAHTKMKYRCVARRRPSCAQQQRAARPSSSRRHTAAACDANPVRRQDGQASKGELSARDLKLELEAKERAAARKRCVAAAWRAQGAAR